MFNRSPQHALLYSSSPHFGMRCHCLWYPYLTKDILKPQCMNNKCLSHDLPLYSIFIINVTLLFAHVECTNTFRSLSPYADLHFICFILNDPLDSVHVFLFILYSVFHSTSPKYILLLRAVLYILYLTALITLSIECFGAQMK